VSDISGVPILDVNSSGLVTVDGPFTQTGGGATTLSGTLNVAGVSTLANVGYLGDGLGSVQYTFQSANDGFATIDFGDVADSNIGRLSYNHNDNSFLIRTNNATALTLDSSQNATFAGSVFAGRTTDIGGFAADDFDLMISNGNTDATELMLYNDAGNYHGAMIQYYNNVMKIGFSSSNTQSTISNALELAAATGNATFAAQAFATTATSSGDASSTLTTKGYVDSLITGATIYRGAWDPSGGGYGSPDLSGVTQTSGYYYICSAAGTAEPNGTGTEPDTWAVGDWVIYNDVSGTGQWQKIDNSSVLSGVGTGQTVALWEGASSVTDSETLGNAPITVSGNNTTFVGKIGIGASPTYDLDIANNNGRFRILGSTGYAAIELQNSANGFYVARNGTVVDSFATGNTAYAGILAVQGNYNLELATNGVVRQTIDGSGNSTFAGQVIANSYLTVTGQATPQIFMASNTAGIPSWTFIARNDGYFLLGRSGVSNDFYLDASGNATFAGMITVNGEGIDIDNNDDIRLRFDNASVFKAGLQVATTVGDMIAGSAVNDFAIRAQENMLFATGGNTEKMRIDSAGNVGIGTTSPTNGKLVIDSTTNQIAIETGTAGDGRLNIGHFSNGTFIGTYGDDGGVADNLRFGTHSGDERMRITSAGNVGIGTTLPGAKFTTSGVIMAIANDNAYNGGYFAKLSSDHGANALKLTSRTGDVFLASNYGASVTLQVGNPNVPALYINASKTVQFNGYDSTNQTGTPTYV
jgi:hypothetical protein